MTNLLSAEGEKVLSCPLHNCLSVFGPRSFVGEVDTKELETLDPFHYSPVDVNGGLFVPVVHDHILRLESLKLAFQPLHKFLVNKL